MTRACRICGYQGEHQEILARESLLQTGEEFLYFQCLRCGTVQIEEIPTDLSRYYPESYYSLSPPASLLRRYRRSHPLKTWLSTLLLEVPFPGKRPLANTRLFPQFLREAVRLGLRRSSSILDVGCGEGLLLRRMYSWGFQHLVGIDPFLSQPLELPGLTLKKAKIEEVEGTFDLIFLSHVVEHVENPKSFLASARRLLHAKGWLLVATPLADSYGYRKYQGSWLGLDPPRHLHVFTVGSLRELAKEAGLRLVRLCYDPGELLWEASRRILLGEPPFGGPTRGDGSRRTRKRCAKMLALLGDADVATFYFMTQ
jgi:SAM-dependent methyltransferase